MLLEYSIVSITISAYTLVGTSANATSSPVVVNVIPDSKLSDHFAVFNIVIIDFAIFSSNGEILESGSIVINFTDNNTLTLTCTPAYYNDSVEWIMINKTGTVERQDGVKCDVQSTVTFVDASDDFTSYMRCNFNNGSAQKDVLAIKSNLKALYLIVA